MEIKSLIKLWRIISESSKRKYYFLLLVLIFTSFFEIVSLALTVPFLKMITSPQVFSPGFDFAGVGWIQKYITITPGNILIAFILSIFLTGFFRFYLLKFSTRLSFLSGANISALLFLKVLNRPYSFHVETNSSELINTIQNKSTNVIALIIMPIIQMLNSIVILIAIIFALCLISLKITLCSILLFGTIYISTALLTRRKLNLNSNVMANSSTKVIQILQEAIGGIREVILDSSQKYFISLYRIEDEKLRNAQSSSTYIGMSPRIVIEAFGMIVIALLAFYLHENTSKEGRILPLLGVFALGAQRLLPVLQQIFLSWSNIKSGSQSLADVLLLLDFQIPVKINKFKLNFDREISFREVSFKYPKSSKYIFKNISIKIIKGERIGIVGVTGGGKSTFLDILMGLQLPTDGAIYIDGKELNEKLNDSWRKNIAHVPQSIFLTSGTIRENIAFGIDPILIDDNLIIESARKSCILDFIDSLPNRFETKIGERGVKLSGGQRQRIGIARALYRKPSLIILDEATSALDEFTEQKVIEQISSINKEVTVIMVTHRLATIKNCNRVIKIKNYKLI
jgi:ABC-type multidrug transport system fused ATPase/permease subunit